MKRDGVICPLIFMYCLVVAFYTLRPQLLLADHDHVAAQPEAVQNVKFEVMPDSPDPNQVFELVNKERIAQGSPALVGNAKLGKVAAERAADMAKRQYYAHRNPDGKIYADLFEENDLRTEYSCENLDIVFVPDISTFISTWMASTKGHRECMINKNLKEAGYAVTKMMLLQFNGKETPAYVVVAIHTTELR